MSKESSSQASSKRREFSTVEGEKGGKVRWKVLMPAIEKIDI